MILVDIFTPAPTAPVPPPIYGPNSTSENPAPAPASVTVNIKNFSFNPAALTIKTGTKVIWANNDSAPHTITSDSGNLLNSS